MQVNYFIVNISILHKIIFQREKACYEKKLILTRFSKQDSGEKDNNY